VLHSQRRPSETRASIDPGKTADEFAAARKRSILLVHSKLQSYIQEISHDCIPGGRDPQTTPLISQKFPNVEIR
jgi:hypothetical protein